MLKRMADLMKAAVLVDSERLEVCDIPLPPLSPYDVRVRTSGVGICGTDVHIYLGYANYNFGPDGVPVPLSRSPQILGHEISGIVEEVGREAKGLKPGDRVIVDQGLNCHSQRIEPVCEMCASNDSHQCLHYREMGITGVPGGFAQYVSIPAVNAVKVENDVPKDEVALAEPLGCVVHAVEFTERAYARYTLAGERRVRNMLILGAGPAGCLFIQYFRNVRGFEGPIFVADPNPRKLELAESFGATPLPYHGEELVRQVLERTHGEKIYYLVEAAGAGAVWPILPGLLRKQATLLLYGHGHHGVDIGALNRVQFLEPTICSPCGASGGFDSEGRPCTYRTAANLLQDAKVRVSPFITHRCNLDTLPRIFNTDCRKPEFFKAVLLQ